MLYAFLWLTDEDAITLYVFGQHNFAFSGLFVLFLWAILIYGFGITFGQKLNYFSVEREVQTLAGDENQAYAVPRPKEKP